MLFYPVKMIEYCLENYSTTTSNNNTSIYLNAQAMQISVMRSLPQTIKIHS